MSDFSPRHLRIFVDVLSEELGVDNLSAVLEKAGLSLMLADSKAVGRLDSPAATQAYAGLQQALRVYYGRGARGILLRVGNQFWKRLLDEAPASLRPQILLTRGMATTTRPKPALDLLVRLLSTNSGDIRVHTLDLDFLLVDYASPTTIGQRDDEPICWVMLGLAREALFWATGHEYDITETSCRALGAQTCEFHIRTGK